MDIKFTISSHCNYYEKTFPVVVKSLLEAGVREEDIYFFIGGYEKNGYEKTVLDLPVQVYKCSHNSFDFTGLVSVLELDLKATYWFLLHDTCYVGKDFYKKLLEYKFENSSCVKLKPSPSMNIGCYHQDYLDSLRDTILTEFKNVSNNREDLDKFKAKIAGHYEDRLLVTGKVLTGHQVNEMSDLYSTGTERILERYDDIQFYKLKANWGAPGWVMKV